MKKEKRKIKNKYKNWQLKLITIGSLFSVFLILLVPFFHNFKTVTKSVESYVALGSAEEKYYDRLEEVSNEYRNEEKDFSKEVIGKPTLHKPTCVQPILNFAILFKRSASFPTDI